jgi:hypothetical protein
MCPVSETIKTVGMWHHFSIEQFNTLVSSLCERPGVGKCWYTLLIPWIHLHAIIFLFAQVKGPLQGHEFESADAITRLPWHHHAI